MKNNILITLIFINILTISAQNIQWEPLVLSFTASDTSSWYNFPLQVTFNHAESGTKLILDGYWDGDKTWKVHFAPTENGTWNWISSSSDSGLNNKSGSITCTAPTNEQKKENPNLHGHLKISPDKHRLEYADRTSFFWLGETNWAITADRCGVDNGHFYTYADNRKAKQFTVIQMQYFEKIYYNEGGYPFPQNADTSSLEGNGEWSVLNNKYFQYVDTRMQYLFDNGFVIAGHPTWFGEISVTLYWAEQITRYLMARYGAYNLVWSLSGEYQFSRKYSYSVNDPSDWDSLGIYAQLYNPYKHPVTVHPTYGKPDYIKSPNGSFADYSSSGEFHNSSWLDINWIQTYKWIEDVSESVYEDYIKTPSKPVILAEPAYEFYQARSRDQQIYTEVDDYLCRLQAWSSILCGAAGHTYGAWGVWQFYDPSNPQSGTERKKSQPWYKRIDAPGASQMQYVKTFFTTPYVKWTMLTPHRDWLMVNDTLPPWPSKSDFTPPHCAASIGKVYVIYIPKGNNDKTIKITHLNNKNYTAFWYNPQNGKYSFVAGPHGLAEWMLPALPDGNDWTFLLTTFKVE